MYAENEGARIWWDVSGPTGADPVLLIHGLGYPHDMWFRVLPVIAAHFRVVVCDNRGSGRSDVTPGPYTHELMARDAVAVLDAAGVERAHVAGISMGSFIAQQLAIHNPERVRSLVLAASACNGPHYVDMEPPVHAVLVNRGKLSADEAFWAMAPYTYDPATPRALLEEDLAVRRGCYPTAEGYYAQMLAGAKLNTFERLHEVTAPTLVIHGVSDQLVPPGNGEDVARRIPGARLVMLENASHQLTTDATDRFNELLLEWFATH